MTNSKLVSEKMYNTIIETCYTSDTELLEKYHALAPAMLFDCVQHTVDVFNKAMGFEMYELNDGDNFVGYYGIENYMGEKYLCGFFLMPDYRNDKWKHKLIDEVVKTAGKPVNCLLYKKNKRGIKFLEKMGFETISMNNDIVYLFLD